MKVAEAGLFLINLDGTVTTALTLAALAAGRPRRPLPTLAEALDLSSEQASQFAKWLDLVRTRHRDLRWDKVAPLAPVQELRSGKGDDEIFLRLTYRKLEDEEGELAAIAVFAVDTAASRAMARQLEEERLRHKLEIRDFLALSANPVETVTAFLDDAGTRLEAARKGWDELQNSNSAQILFRELHMLKGNAGAFGFEGLAASAQESEELLETLKRPSAMADRLIARLGAALAGLRTQLEEIRRALRLITGEGQDAMARILKWKLERLVNSAAVVDVSKLDPQLRTFVEATRKVHFLSPAYLARKYSNLVDRLSHNQGKQVIFRVTSNTGDIHPESFSRVDEALVHILRNMVDHGIESPEDRDSAGKEEAEIGLEYVAEEDRIFLRIRDNGRGMDPEAIADQAVSMGLLTRSEVDALDVTAKLGLIFKEGFTTRPEAGMVSGRGLGLALAARCVADQGGNLYVYSRPGEGTRFAIELPPIGLKKLP